MSGNPIEPAPDTIDPHAPPEAPPIACPPEGPGRAEPEYVCPQDPSDTPGAVPAETPQPSDG